MREILFKGKCSENSGLKGKWVEGDRIVYDDGMSNKNSKLTVYILPQGGRSWDILEGGYQVDPDTVGQYTGRTDKKAKKIFEGDIVLGGEDGKQKGVVVFSETNAMFSIRFDEEDTENDYLLNPSYLLEIIGNIHDEEEG